MEAEPPSEERSTGRRDPDPGGVADDESGPSLYGRTNDQFVPKPLMIPLAMVAANPAMFAEDAVHRAARCDRGIPL